MKKIAVVLVAVLLLFSGCGNSYRDVKLSDFKYEYDKDKKQIRVVANYDITDLEITYHLTYGYLITETNTLKCGKLEADRIYYFAIINQFEREFAGLEVIDVKGKVDKTVNEKERNARIEDITISGNIITEEDISYFTITPKVTITNFNISYILKKGTGSFQWRFENTISEVIAGTEYKIEVPIFTAGISRAADVIVGGTVLLET